MEVFVVTDSPCSDTELDVMIDVALQMCVRATGSRKACTDASFLVFILFNKIHRH